MRIKLIWCLGFWLLVLLGASVVNARMAGDFEIPAKRVVKPVVPVQGSTFTELVTGMKFVWVPEGCFQMGSNNGDSDEKPVHKVCVDGFWMGKYEVTQGQWRKLMGSNPSRFQKGNKYPVEAVSWDDCQEFIKKLNRRSNKTFRLPTEAEWEYACRSKAANGLGFHDRSGNVYEWCSDWYGENYYRNSPVQKPQGPGSGSYRVLRGGGRNIGSWYRSAERKWNSPGARGIGFGFRLVSPGRN